MRALVTGCAGFIGSHLTQRLLEQGTSVVGVDSFTNYYARESKKEISGRDIIPPNNSSASQS